MEECFQEEEKDIYTCTTNDKKIYSCLCCDSSSFSRCYVKYFENAWNLDALNEQLIAKYQLFDEYHYIDDAVNTNYLENHFDWCEKHQILPMWCNVIKVVEHSTVCGCQLEDSIGSIDIKYYNTSDVWNKHPCEITDEHKIFLANQSSFHVILGVFLFLFCILMSLLGFIVFRKIRANYKRQINVDEVELEENQ